MYYNDGITDIKRLYRFESELTQVLSQNLHWLGQELRIDLNLIDTEVDLGIGRADILAEESRLAVDVVIENQLTPSDGRHLSQLIDYVHRSRAGIGVWVAAKLSQRKIRNLHWMNSNSYSTIFFGVEVNTLTTDGYSVEDEPVFEVVAYPDEWTGTRDWIKSVDPNVGDGYRQFWQPLVDELRDTHGFTGHIRTTPKPYYYFGSGYRQFKYVARFIPSDDKMCVGLEMRYPRQDENGYAYWKLLESQDEIESSLDTQLIWDTQEFQSIGRIRIRKYGDAVLDSSDRRSAECRSWMIYNLLNFKRAFTPHLNELDR